MLINLDPAASLYSLPLLRSAPVADPPSFLLPRLLPTVGCTDPQETEDESAGPSPERVDAVDCPGHVLLVINVCGLREESLGEKPAGYSHQKHHYMSHRERDEERCPLPRLCALCGL